MSFLGYEIINIDVVMPMVDVINGVPTVKGFIVIVLLLCCQMVHR